MFTVPVERKLSISPFIAATAFRMELRERSSSESPSYIKYYTIPNWPFRFLDNFPPGKPYYESKKLDQISWMQLLNRKFGVGLRPLQ